MAAPPPADSKPKTLGIKRALKRLFGKSPTRQAGEWTHAASADQLATGNASEAGAATGNSDSHRYAASSSHIDLRSDKTTTQATNLASEKEIAPADAVISSAVSDEMPLEDSNGNKLPSRAKLLADKQKKSQENKENIPPAEEIDNVTASMGAVQIDGASEHHPDPVPILETDPVIAAERAQHLRFIGEALDMARLALKINETPVGCVLVRNGEIIARGMNATNVTRNGTRHAEFMAICALLSSPSKTGPRTTRLKPKELSEKEARDMKEEREALIEDGESVDTASETASLNNIALHEGNEDGSKSHLYPYGQKLISDKRVNKSIITESILYVTVEPCIMCASLLRQLGIKKVYFGAVNDKFGGTGGVFSIHANSLPVSEDGQTASAHPMPRATQLADGTGGTLGISFPPGGGDGGNVEAGYEIEGGWGRDEAVGLLRRFYVQENGRAPVPRKKEGRAARLAAIENGELIEGEDQLGDTTPTSDAIPDNFMSKNTESSGLA